MIENVAAFGARLAGATKRVKDAGKIGTLQAGEHVLGVSNTLVPLEEADLARSGGVSQDEATGRTAISYDTDYAVKQHEDESLRHDPGRQAKFLTTALARERETALQIVAQALKGAMGG
jgi:hypothetical protein